jgi:hypothetical protein
MMGRRGVASRGRVLLRVAPVLFLLIGGARDLDGQISPGPVSKAHQSISGVTECTSCHRLVTVGGGLTCLGCHTEINQRLTANKGYHAAVVKRDNPDNDCARCHSEHNGEKFQLIRWEPSEEKFDHNKTGYPLDGKHATTKCKDCHNASRIQTPWKKLIKEKDLNRSFLGLSQSCISCHEDFHKGQLSKDCQSCHNTTTWKDTARFDHSKTKYPLTGLHAKVACAKCHLPEGPNQQPKYTGLKFSSCVDCHADPHHGAFQKKDCASCHSTAGWKQIGGISAQFNHDKTNFPLFGKHQGVRCEACHRTGDFKAPIPYKLCWDCHRPDPHGGQFAKRKDRGECESCHTVDGWKPSTFTVADHRTSDYPLEGAHAKVECAKCHIPEGVATQYRIKFGSCTDCHKDEHAGQFAAPPLSNRCESCHTVNTFAPSTFTLALHQKTRFVLEGAHLAVACADCHSAKQGQPTSSAPYHFRNLACTTCHEDVHLGEFKVQMAGKKRDGRVAGCEACHSVKDWKDLPGFDHDKTDYPLVGSHRAVACINCHKPPNRETTMQHVSFKAAPRDCKSCHEDVHAHQFARVGDDPGCDECHNTIKWTPSLFDHEKTAFSLKGAHEQVKCGACHNNLRRVRGKQVLFYFPTPKECVACHGSTVSEVRISPGLGKFSTWPGKEAKIRAEPCGEKGGVESDRDNWGCTSQLSSRSLTAQPAT